MKGIIVDDYNDKKFCKLLIINEDGSRELYEPSSGGFVKTKDFPPPATINHTHITEGYSGEIKHGNNLMTFKDGLLVTYE